MHAKTCTAVLFSGFAIVFEKELKLGTEILFQEIFLRKKGIGPLKIVRAAFEILAEGRGEKLFLLRKKCTGPPLIAVGSLCFLTVFRIDKRANALVNSLILQRKIIVILIVREEIFQLRRMRRRERETREPKAVREPSAQTRERKTGTSRSGCSETSSVCPVKRHDWTEKSP